MIRRLILPAVWTAALLFPIAVTLALVPILKTWQPLPPPQINVADRITACRSETLNGLKAEKPNIDLYRQLSAHCYMQVRGEALLIDFNIRRLNLINQQIDGRVILWMVVAITVAGVILAAFQLLAAFRLASAGKGEFAQSQELTLEQNKISVKSSVTGLMIFVISFAFFMVYVVWVYTAKELRQESPEGQAPTVEIAPSVARSVPFLGIGGAGSLPSKEQPGVTTPAGP